MGVKKDDITIAAPPEAAATTRWIVEVSQQSIFSIPRKVSRSKPAKVGTTYVPTKTGICFVRSADRNRTSIGIARLSGVHASRREGSLVDSQRRDRHEQQQRLHRGRPATLQRYIRASYDRYRARGNRALATLRPVVRGTSLWSCTCGPPPTGTQALTTNTARTMLLLDGEKAPWEDWAYEFRQNMPKGLPISSVRRPRRCKEKDHTNNIKDRLKNVMDLYKVSRYRPDPLDDLSLGCDIPQPGLAALRSADASGGWVQPVTGMRAPRPRSA